MKRTLMFTFCIGVLSACAWPVRAAETIGPSQRLKSVEIEPHRAGDPSGRVPVRGKVLADTTWIADWSFEVGPTCDETGWTKVDNRILNDGTNYWSVDTHYTGVGFIVGSAAELRKHDLCWSQATGYGNNWDSSVILQYQGANSTLAFHFLSDSEPDFDFVTIEADSAGLSESRVDFDQDPLGAPEDFRVTIFVTDGPNLSGQVSGLQLPDFEDPGSMHEVYIRFTSDGGYSDEDGLYLSSTSAGLVVDNVQVSSSSLSYTEDFEGTLDPHVTLANTRPAVPFGGWSRLFSHITDNDRCTENETCGWIFTDNTTPTVGSGDNAYGPSGYVIRNWLDEILVSPWIDLDASSDLGGTILSFRRFPGNEFTFGKIVQNWSVRSKLRIENTDTSAPGDSIDCVLPWDHVTDWNSLGLYTWVTSLDDMSIYIQPGAREIQVRFRQSDWQYITDDDPPVILNPGPGPFVDRVRIGRLQVLGPVISEGIDARSQAQDAFPASVNGTITPGEHHQPTLSRFGSVPFNRGSDLGTNTPGSPQVITGDSVTVEVVDVRNSGGITSVDLYGAIVSGPHAGKSPPPYTVASNGFFQVPADSSRSTGGIALQNQWFVDLPDDYFYGGDVFVYFWAATDAQGGFASDPAGLDALPASVTEAEEATGGLLEMSALPTIAWSQMYLDRIAADPHGHFAPDQTEIDDSQQATCILYYNQLNSRRRSGPLNRTSMMYTLEQLGYGDSYDVYDVTGYGNTNNQLGGRARPPQATGYALIIHDTGRSVQVPSLPDGSSIDNEKIDQATWYRNWLDLAPVSEISTATLWLIGENIVQQDGLNPLFLSDAGVQLASVNQGLPSPEVEGKSTFIFSDGGQAEFTGKRFSLDGGCPLLRDYDGLDAGSGQVTHRYLIGAVDGDGAIVMRARDPYTNVIVSSFGWFDIRDSRQATTPGVPALDLLFDILQGTLPEICLREEDPTGTRPGAELQAPAVTALHPNVPNPFNPTTELRFDLSRRGPVHLAIYDVSGRLVRTLLDEVMDPGRNLRVRWNGLDGAGNRVSSGIYFGRLETNGFSATRKMAVLQ